jgi:4-amino-4-deoxy-L-arabinose transferase-like glycosyltransferase
MRDRFDAKTIFVTLWVALLLLKALVAARLPLFVDEAFYWQEGQHLAWAYSDLPGMTAWLIRLGGELFGDGVLAVRSLFLAVSALLPWWVVRIARREVGAHEGWVAGCAALLLPLFGTLGVLALPDVAMTLATLWCLDAVTRMFRGVSHGAALQLALGLSLGALSHYRFIAVLGAGFVALLLLARGRELLRDPRVLVALAAGAAAWIPLLAWNIENAEAGLRFQLVERHPWALHVDGILFLPIQAAFVTPLLLAALLWAAWRGRSDPSPGIRLLAWSGAILVGGFFVLGFFADTERVSFHWPLPGYVALLPLLPLALARWPRWWRRATWALAACGVLAMLAYYAAVSVPELRERAAGTKWYPDNFSGWEDLAQGVRSARDGLPPGTRIIADNFKVGAQLGFALGDPAIPVVEHPLNRAHGRAPQLRLWGLKVADRGDLPAAPVLLVVSPSDVKLSELLARYQDLCRRFATLPSPRVVEADRGGKRFLLLPLDAPPTGARADATAPCVPPAIAHVNRPLPDARVSSRFTVEGWAIKDVVGVSRVEVTLDGQVVATARYGLRDELPQAFYRGGAKDPSLPDVGFRADVDAGAFPPGRHWLGLRVTGSDGSVETFPSHVVELRAR